MSSIRQVALEQEQSQDAIDRDSEVGIFRLINQQPSGFIQKGTERMPDPIELMNPGRKSILTTSAYAKPHPGGKGFSRVPIRYLASSDKIHIKEQEDDRATVNPVDDRIEFVNGQIVVANEGAGVGMLNFMRHDSRNALGKNRIKSVDPIYTEIFPEKEKIENNEDIFAEAEAISFVKSLITGKTAKGGVQYDDDRLNALSRLFNVVADSPAGKISALIANAKINPSGFLKRAQEYEQTVITEITHAIQLGVISIDGTKVGYIGSGEVITTQSDKLSKDQKIKRLANFFSTAQGEHHYKKFKIELNDRLENNI